MIKQEIIENNIKVISLDAERGNLLSFDDINVLSDIIFQVKQNTQIKGVILTGLNRSFCTGLKLPEISNRNRFLIFKIFDELLLNLFCLPKPLIVAASGHSIGGGLLIQLCADYIIMSDNEKIKIGLPELKLSTALDALMINLIEYSVGNYRDIQKLVYSSQYIQPKEALEYKLCDALINDSKVFQTALERTQQLISYNSNFFEGIKNTLREEKIKNMHINLKNKCYNIYNTIING
jgi:enoyl-CoA hydratase/carnithine racemase